MQEGAAESSPGRAAAGDVARMRLNSRGSHGCTPSSEASLGIPRLFTSWKALGRFSVGHSQSSSWAVRRPRHTMAGVQTQEDTTVFPTGLWTVVQSRTALCGGYRGGAAVKLPVLL